MKRQRSFITLMLFIGVLAAPAEADLPGSFSGGAVTGNAVLGIAGSPYTITEPIDIPAGSSLSVNPGVEIIGQASVIFRLQGSLSIAGTDKAPVRISVRSGFVNTVAQQDGSPAQSFEMSHAVVAGGAQWSIDASRIVIEDSDIRSQVCSAGHSLTIRNSKSLIQRNFLESTCGFQFNLNFGVFGPRGTMLFRDNFLSGNSQTGPWVSASSLWGDELDLKGNTFHQVSNIPIESGFFETYIHGDDNYWGLLSLDQVRSLVPDSAGDVFEEPWVILDSIASSPSSAAPTGPNFAQPMASDPLAHLSGHGPNDGVFSAWTKMLANGTQMKFYAKYLQPGQKVQFMVQNSEGRYEQVAWKRVGLADLGSQGEYLTLQNHVYFIRTIDLKPGKNRVRILVDGEIFWGTKTYSRNYVG